MKRRINKVAVIGSGIMGSGIACVFANIGLQVKLFDIAPTTLLPEEESKGLTLDDPKVKNRIVEQNFAVALKHKPALLYKNSYANRISTLNLTDDLSQLKDVDWVIEVVTENLEIKKSLFDKIEPYISEQALITSNTSGIPIHLMLSDRSESFQKKFCGTHFFNPPRYLPLLEIIPTDKTERSIVDFLMDYGTRFLGKKTILAKDTPAFIANRIGVYSIMNLFHLVKKYGFTVEEIDKLTGPLIGRPKSATFRTADVVGLDTLVHVANGLTQNAPNDEAISNFQLPDFIQKMQKNNWLGSKTDQGFFKKIIGEDGKPIFQYLNLDTMEYENPKKPKIEIIDTIKNSTDWSQKWNALINDKTKVGELFRESLGGLFAYVSNRIPEIADNLYQIDDAIKAGFGWTQGPFEIWQMIGLERGLQLITDSGNSAAPWVNTMMSSGLTFYPPHHGAGQMYYNIRNEKAELIPDSQNIIILDKLKEHKIIWQNKACCLLDLGDGIVNLDFSTKMNAIDADVLMGIQKSIDIAEKEYDGLVISNQSENFSVGANIGMIFMYAAEQEWDELHMAIKYFQDTMMRIRYSSIPVVVAPYNMTLGGACEMCMHADKVVAHSESYIGLVELGVGVIPGGGGTKEMVLRASNHYRKGDVETNILQEYFMTVAMAKVSTSAAEAYDLGYLQNYKDIIVMSKDWLIHEAKLQAKSLAERGYSRPLENTQIKVHGKEALGMFDVGISSMVAGHYISEYDKTIAKKLAYVMSGGDLSEPTMVSETYLLQLEREAFLSLCGERKTLERIQHMLTTGKPLRN